MELNQLKYLVKLGELKNFSKAADELFITQPTLSQQIRKLEQELGVRLFERSTKKVTLTEAGHTCVQHAQRALDCIKEMQAAAESYRRKENAKLSIGVIPVLPNWNITEVLASFREKYPHIDVELHFGWSTELTNQLLLKELDIIIANVYFNDTPSYEDELEIEAFLEDYMVVVASKKSVYSSRKNITLDELTQEIFWTVAPYSSAKIRIENYYRNNKLPIPEFKQCTSMSILHKMIASNMGISAMSATVAKEYHIPELKSIPIKPRINTATAIVTLKNSTLTSELKTFKNFFLSSVHKL